MRIAPALTALALCMTSACGDDSHTNRIENYAGPVNEAHPEAQRVATLTLNPSEFTSGTVVNAKGSFPPTTLAGPDSFPCPDSNHAPRHVQANRQYIVSFVNLDEAGRETNTLTAPSTSIPFAAPGAETWLERDFPPITIPQGLDERLRVTLAFSQLRPEWVTNQCTPRESRSAIASHDYRRTCAGQVGVPGAARCRYVEG